MMPQATGDILGLLANRVIRHLLVRWRQRGPGTIIALILSLWAFVFQNWTRIPGLSTSPTHFVTRLLTSSIVVQDERLKSEVLNWVAVNVLVRQQTRVLNACSSRSNRRPNPRLPLVGKPIVSMENIRYLPALRNTLFFYKRRPFCLDYSRSSSPPVMDYDTGMPVFADNETLKVLCLGRSASPIKDFLATCRTFAKDQRESFVIVRFSSGGHSLWDQKALMPMRPLDTIHLSKDTKSELLNDVKNYLEPRTRRFYVSHAIPYRRGYLFYGPPGTGKTSLAIAIAGFAGLPLFILSLPSIDSDRNLTTLFGQLDPKCIVLLEDIDAVGMKRDREEQGQDKHGFRAMSMGCTLSGLLNVLDGVTSQEGRIIIMTANEPENLDEALVRRGRIDKEVYLGHISVDSAQQMFMRMTEPEATTTAKNGGDSNVDKSDIPTTELDASPSSSNTVVDDDTREKLSHEFSCKIPENKITPAQLQEYLLYHRGNPEGAAKNISGWIDEEMASRARKEKEKAKKKEKRVGMTETDIEKKMDAMLERRGISMGDLLDLDELI